MSIAAGSPVPYCGGRSNGVVTRMAGNQRLVGRCRKPADGLDRVGPVEQVKDISFWVQEECEAVSASVDLVGDLDALALKISLSRVDIVDRNRYVADAGRLHLCFYRVAFRGNDF